MGIKQKAWISHAVSLTLHALCALALFLLVNHEAMRLQSVPPIAAAKLVYLTTPPGPDGGGGGSFARAAPAETQLPKPRPVDIVPAVSAAPAEAPPTITAPVMTSVSAMLTASGVDGTIEMPRAGTGRGTGLGPGNGTGMGPGSGLGFDGTGKAGFGGIELPRRISEVKPRYTADAMRAKVQGAVVMEAIVDTNGRVSDVRITKSLDRLMGLDDEARRAAFDTRFTPCKKAGVPVACVIIFELQFNLR